MVLLLAATSYAEAPKWIGAFFVKGKVGLKWQAVEGAASFNVYRKSATEDYKNIASLEETHHFDTDLVPGSIYTYKIAAVGSDGSEKFSTEKSVTIPSAQIGEFEPPTWVGLRVDRDKIFLNWDPVPGAIAYNIYRSPQSGSGYEVVGNVTVAKYADKDGLEAGKPYYYVLTALNEEFEETEYSEEMSIKFGMSAEEREALSEVEQIELEAIPLTLLFDITRTGPGDDMNQPADVALNSKGNIYITDALNYRVNCHDGTGKYLFSFGEMTDPSDKGNPPSGTFSYPFSLFIDKDDNVYVTDVRNNDIQVFSEDGKFIRRITVAAGVGQEEFRPNCIYVLDDGRIVSTDAGNHRFVIIDQNGNVLLEKGSRGAGNDQFIFPDGLTVTEDGIICIVDVINCRIQQFDLDGNFIRNFGEAGQTVGTFGRPKAITIGEDGKLWISDALANAVQVFTVEGEIKSVISQFEDESIFLATPRGIRVKDGRFYVVNRLPNQVMVFEIGK
jgi:sugar lactone lactonase YvrE